jgi:hypothetical protein
MVNKKEPIDAEFTVKEGTGKGFTNKKPLNGWIPEKESVVPPSGAYPFKDDSKSGAAKRFLRGTKKVGKGVLAASSATKKGIISAAKTQSAFRKTYYDARATSLERRQNIATYRANIAQQRFQAEQARTTRLESRLARESIKRQAKQQRAIERSLAPKKTGGFGGLKRSPLADRATNRVNINKSRGGFFSGIGKKPLADKNTSIKRNKGGFFR